MNEATFNSNIDSFDLDNQSNFNTGINGFGAVFPIGTLGSGVDQNTLDDTVNHWSGLSDTERETYIKNRKGTGNANQLGWGIGCPCEEA